MINQIISRLQARQPLPPLCPAQVWDAELSREIQNAPDLSDGVRAGLLLWNDDLDASHSISQGINTPTGSFWHAIMHRREGDYSNAEYWCRRIGMHPAFEAIYQASLVILESEDGAFGFSVENKLKLVRTWLPESFVYDCQRHNRGLNTKPWILEMQVAEMETLLRWCREHGE